MFEKVHMKHGDTCTSPCTLRSDWKERPHHWGNAGYVTHRQGLLSQLSNRSLYLLLIPIGIGQAVALALGEAGAGICVVARPGNTNSTTIDALRALPVDPQRNSQHVTIECDLGDLDDVRTLFDRALKIMNGEIHVLVNCAGIQRRSPAVDFTDEDWDAVC